MQLAVRNTDIELMDNPNLEIHELKKVFKDINRVNNLLGGSKISLRELWKLIKESPKKSYTILDMGCGDGFMLRKAALFLRQRNISANLIGLDLREDILSIAREASKDFPEISYKKQNVLLLNPDKFAKKIPNVIHKIEWKWAFRYVWVIQTNRLT